MQDEWVNIIDFPDYKINKHGEIISTSRTMFNGKVYFLSKEKFIYPRVDNRGYLYISLRNNGIEKKFRIHRLIAKHFLPSYDESKTINHIDGNKNNNLIENLECITLKENIQHAVNNKLHAYGKKQYNSKLNDELVKEIRNKYIPRKITIKQLSNIYNVSEQVIFDVIHYNTWKHVI
jgi:hypothetical protein